jgi:hypothetical protein
MSKCYLYCTLSRQAEFPNYPKFCLSEIGSAPLISDNRGSTVVVVVVVVVVVIAVVVPYSTHVSE